VSICSSCCHGFATKRIQEKIDALNVKVAHINFYNDGGPMGKQFQEEINQYKAIVKCSVCHDPPKEVVFLYISANPKSLKWQ